MEEDDVRLFENRMWEWVNGGFRGFVIPDEKVKLRRLRYLLNKHKRSVREARTIDLNEILEVVKLKKECLLRLTDEDMLYLLLFKIMTTAERDEIKGGDRL